MAHIQLSLDSHQPQPGMKVISLTGGLTIETVSAFNQSLRDDSTPVLLLNLTKLDWLDSSGVGALVQLLVRREKAKNRLALTGLTPRTHAVLQVSQLLRLFNIFTTTDQAVEQLAQSSGQSV